ncbi:MAG TPA: septum formation initiator family protein [Vicinamibacterales bacterium]|jgi:cell division protein FtsB
MAKTVRDQTVGTMARDGGPVHAAPRHRPVIVFVLLFLAVALVLDGIAGERGWLANRQAQQQLDLAMRALEQARRQNEELREDVQRLRTDPATIEEVARRDLGFIRPGEKVFIVRDVPKPTK